MENEAVRNTISGKESGGRRGETRARPKDIHKRSNTEPTNDRIDEGYSVDQKKNVE